MFKKSILLFLIISLSTFSQEYSITQQESHIFVYNKFANSIIFEGGRINDRSIYEIDLISSQVSLTDFPNIIPAMFHLSNKCVYQHLNNSTIYYKVRNLDTGEEEIILQYDLPKALVAYPPHYSINPSDEYMFNKAGWSIDLGTKEIIGGDNPDFEICGVNDGYAWKNDTTIVYVTCDNRIAEYDIITSEITEVVSLDLPDGDEILNLDFNREYQVIAFTTGKADYDPIVYTYSLFDHSLRKIYECFDLCGTYVEMREIKWSPDNNYLACTVYDFLNPASVLLIYDIKDDIVSKFNDVSYTADNLRWINENEVAYLDNLNRRINGYDVRGAILGVDDDNLAYNNYQLCAYPNPFNDQVNIRFLAPSNSKIKFKITDILGRIVYEEDIVSSGSEESLFWSIEDNRGRSLSSGIYIVTVAFNKHNLNARRSLKLLLLK